jgi:hypothetical protein
MEAGDRLAGDKVKGVIVHGHVVTGFVRYEKIVRRIRTDVPGSLFVERRQRDETPLRAGAGECGARRTGVAGTGRKKAYGDRRRESCNERTQDLKLL